jgi:hypothetical protein
LVHEKLAAALRDVDASFPSAASTAVRRSGSVRPSDAVQWIVNEDRPHQWIVEQTGSPTTLQIRRWGNWYDYPGSYWRSNNRRMSDIDRGEEHPWKYLMHMIVGHHGVLSLTPIFLLSLFGVLPLCLRNNIPVRLVAMAGLAITIVVFAFYVTRPAIDRNYGGMTSGLRWVFWLYPFWLMWMVPAVERAFRRKWLSIGVCFLLLLSIASAQFSADNPWVHPWLYQWMVEFGLKV